MKRVAIGIAACFAATSVQAKERKVDFNVPPGPLNAAIPALGQQAGITIGSGDPLLGSTRTRGVSGHLTIPAALTRMLAGTGFTFIPISANAVRIERSTPVVRGDRPRPMWKAQETAALSLGDITVTASKQSTSLSRFAGTVRFVDVGDPANARSGARGTELLLDRLPMLASTNLGPGRNKLYIRGIADSSFNGPSQSIVGQYLGDIRLTFNAPDPDLQLYDMKRVEVLEGPQGTLYGSGALGGILRLIPNEPDPRAFSGALSTGGLVTQHGGTGGDIAATGNLPLVADRLALRVVGYGSRSPGYINDIGLGRSNVNRTTIYGGRATTRWDAGNGWAVDLGGLIQFIHGRDGQYAMAGLPPLTRRSYLAQPFHNDYKLGHLVIRKRWGDVEFVSATGVVEHDVSADFDATDPRQSPVRQIFLERTAVRMISNETHLSRSGPNGDGWVAGMSIVHDTDRLSRHFGAVSNPPPIAGVRNETTEAALFGQFGYAITDTLVATVGGRLTFADTTGLSVDTRSDHMEPRRRELRLTPTAGIAWRGLTGTTLFVRYQQGYRA
ncbi:MAG TPA: TonB-dependent receptor, partial [Acetobacteraceae bacterium]|nr:TonB-dependent receptor [Acetobacteraceae bacterium]